VRARDGNWCGNGFEADCFCADGYSRTPNGLGCELIPETFFFCDTEEEALAWCQNANLVGEFWGEGNGAGVRALDLRCGNSFISDCYCEDGYEMTTDRLACHNCHYRDRTEWCQQLASEGAEGVTSPSSQSCYYDWFLDCDCRDGWRYNDARTGCVSCNVDNRDDWCRDNWRPNSVAKPNVLCYDTPEVDCECPSGYALNNDQCVDCHLGNRDDWCREQGGEEWFAAQSNLACYFNFDQHCVNTCTGDSMVFDRVCQFCNRADPTGWCRGIGGQNSFALDGQTCYFNFDDHCGCDDGYIKDRRSCVKDCHFDDPDAWCASIGGEGAYAKDDASCYEIFDQHCQCYTGYTQSADSCGDFVVDTDGERGTGFGLRDSTPIQIAGNGKYRNVHSFACAL